MNFLIAALLWSPVACDWTRGSNNFSGSNELHVATAGGGFTTLAIDAPIYALGADFGAVSDSRTSAFMIGGMQLDIPEISSGFFGFVSDTSFTNAAMTLTSGSADGCSMDNLVYSSVHVPEPSSLALLGLAMVGLSLRGRKERQLITTYRTILPDTRQY